MEVTQEFVRDCVNKAVEEVMQPIITQQKAIIEKFEKVISKQKNKKDRYDLEKEKDKVIENYEQQIKDLQFQHETLAERAISSGLKNFTSIEGYDGLGAFHSLGEDLYYPRMVQSAEQIHLQSEAELIRKNLSLASVSEALEYGSGLVGSSLLTTTIKPVNLATLQEIIRRKLSTDGHARSVIENLTSYTVGQGIDFKCINEEVYLQLLDFWIRNGMKLRQRKMVWETFVNGEYFNVFYSSDSNVRPIVDMRFMPPQLISDIERSSDDISTILSYTKSNRAAMKQDKEYIADLDYFSRLREYEELGITDRSIVSVWENQLNEQKRIQYIYLGAEDNARGEPVLLPVLRWFQYYTDWLTDRVVINHERSKVVWTRDVATRLRGVIDRTTLPPRGGQILFNTPESKWGVMNAQIHADDVSADGRAILRRIAAGVRMPLFILDQNAENENYASIRKSDSPFSQAILDYQNFWIFHIDRMFRAYLKILVKNKALTPTVMIPQFKTKNIREAIGYAVEAVNKNEDTDSIRRGIKDKLGPTHKIRINTENAPIEISMPKMVREDSRQLAEVIYRLREIRALSLSTACSMVGLDFETEVANQLIEAGLSKEYGIDLDRKVDPIPKNDELKKYNKELGPTE